MNNNVAAGLVAITGTLVALISVFLQILIIGLIVAWPTMMLWNGCLVDAVAGISPIGLLQAWGINILCGILFKSTAKGSK